MTDARLADLEVLRKRFCEEAETTVEGLPLPNRDLMKLAGALKPDGSWPDIVYDNGNLKDWTAAEHLRRLRQLARAWFRARQKSRNQDRLLKAVLSALDGWYARNPQNPNWWWMQIGAPLLLGETLLCIKGSCDPSTITRAEPAFRAHDPVIRFTGQNLVWTATVMLYHAILTDNPEQASLAFMLIGREVRVFPDDEGLQPDMSFHQHGKMLYSGGYGQAFAGDIGRLVALAAGTAYAFPKPLVNRFTRFILDGSRWMVRGRTFDPGAIGREISRQGLDASRFFSGLQALSRLDQPRQPEALESAGFDPKTGRSLVSGNRYFWCSDFMVQHRPAYYLSIRMPSPRILNADFACCGGEGRLCHHIADGVTHILCDGDEYRDVYPAWNWRQIPGTTAVQTEGPFNPETLRLPGEKPFAGGASDGAVGCAAVDFSRAGLQARKAWFLFDDGLVALGAGITCPGPDPVRTTLNQCRRRGPVFQAGSKTPLPDGLHPLAPGSAFWHDRVAYHILDGAGTLRLGDQTGAWSDCGVGSPDPVTIPMLNAGLDHGTQPKGASYAYLVRPGLESVKFSKKGSASFVILRNEPCLQAVWHDKAKRGHAVFYAPGSVSFPDGLQLGVDRPCIVLYHPTKRGRLIFTVAQPEQLDGLITLRLKGKTSAELGVSLPSHDYAGASQTVFVSTGKE
jgi:chondroitin AC lyase